MLICIYSIVQLYYVSPVCTNTLTHACTHTPKCWPLGMCVHQLACAIVCPHKETISSLAAFKSSQQAPFNLWTVLLANVDLANVHFTTHLLRYYVKVAAENSAGAGVARAASPTSAYPSQQTPGIPVGLFADNSTSGTTTVTWDFPLVPSHGIPCFGTEDSPTICPTPVGGLYPGSDGGNEVYEYRIEWSTSLG